MQDLIVSLNKNTLRLSTIDKEISLKTASTVVPKDIVDETRILDPGRLSDVLNDLVLKVSSLNKSKLSLNFLMEPEDILLRFVTVSKNGNDVGEQIISEIKEKNPDISLEHLYFSYKKMAPFIYQFVGVRKDVMDNYMKLSNKVGIGFKSIIPWILALPKYEKVNDPSIFVSKVDGNQVIALSELNGVFFAGTYQKEKSPEELQSLIKDLSFYKRSSPIKYIYTLNCDSFSIPNYEVKKITFPEFNSSGPIPEGFELNTIVNFLLDSDPDIIGSQLNMLNLLPLPVVETKSSALVITGSVVGALLLIVGAYFGIRAIGNNNSVRENQMAQENEQSEQNSQVLSESVEKPNQEENIEGGGGTSADPNLEVKKGNLKIKVMNGAGISGLAGRTKDFLNNLGYTALIADTADSKVETTILDFKKEFKDDYEKLVVEDMKTKFPKIEVKQDIPENSDYDLIITVGTSSEL